MEPVQSFDQAVKKLEGLEDTLMKLDNSELPAKVLEFEEAYDNLLHAFKKSLKPNEDLPEEVVLAMDALSAAKQNQDLAKMPEVKKAVEGFSQDVAKIRKYYDDRLRQVTESEKGGAL